MSEISVRPLPTLGLGRIFLYQNKMLIRLSATCEMETELSIKIVKSLIEQLNPPEIDEVIVEFTY